VASTTGRRRPWLNLERHYEAWRLEEQIVTAAYALLVPLLRRSVSSQPSAGRTRGDRGAAAGHPRQAVGG
jgi:hypothetical protein